jgi:hypothetical protein
MAIRHRGKKYWYQVTATEMHNGSNKQFYCSSRHSATIIANMIKGNKAIIFHDLVAWPKDKGPIPWSEYDKGVLGDIIIPAANIMTVIPIVGDPKNVYGNKI